MLSFSYQVFSGLDGCQGAVHGLSAGTDDILLKASIDPRPRLIAGLKTEGMGKGHLHVDLFTACPHEMA